MLEKHSASRLPSAHCYELFRDADDFQRLLDDELGRFYNRLCCIVFKRLAIQGLGLDRYLELKYVYFKHYKKLVYMAKRMILSHAPWQRHALSN